MRTKPFFLSVIRQHLNTDIKLNSWSKGTKKNKRCYYKSIVSYFKSRSIMPRPTEVDDFMLIDLSIYLKDKGREDAYISRVIGICKHAMNLSKKRKLVDFNTIFDYKPAKVKVKEVVNLEVDEIQKFVKFSHSLNGMMRTRDCYLAQIITGMSLGDLKTYRIEVRAGITWLVNERRKNGKEYQVPLSKISLGGVFMEIHERNGGKLKPLNERDYNLYLRRIAAMLGINKYITTHTGRKTFATRMFEEGKSEEDIALMMGITTQVLVKHYINVSLKRLFRSVQHWEVAEPVLNSA